MTCNNCGSENENGNYCTCCGAELAKTKELFTSIGEDIADKASLDREERELLEQFPENNNYYDAGYVDFPENDGFYNGNDSGITGGNTGFAIVSLICGIFSMVCCMTVFFSIILAIVAIVFGIVTVNKKYDGMGIAIAGITTGGIGIILAALFMAIFYI
ncbi:MAG: DUF4190 domain-containing protein [Lachnospiraceae bacterium]|nr:DUF4190 domain-containing protein [Lachnospiraceae bacterium]